jgi:anti-sigma regulatory factor (Ser/Thr protein kinase)
VLLALDEAVSNAIRHGSRGGEQVLVTVESDDEWVEMTVRDGGPTPRLPHLPAEPPPVLQTGGRGLWLILQLVDEVRLQRIEDGTRLTMRRRVTSSEDSMVGPDGSG